MEEEVKEEVTPEQEVAPEKPAEAPVVSLEALKLKVCATATATTWKPGVTPPFLPSPCAGPGSADEGSG